MVKPKSEYSPYDHGQARELPSPCRYIDRLLADSLMFLLSWPPVLGHPELWNNCIFALDLTFSADFIFI